MVCYVYLGCDQHLMYIHRYPISYADRKEELARVGSGRGFRRNLGVN